jgi:hypothetical protein
VHRRHAAERAGREHGESRPRPLERPA